MRRVFRFLLCLRVDCDCQRLRFLYTGAGADFRAGGAGRSAPHPVLRELGEISAGATAVVEAALIPAALRVPDTQTGGEPGKDSEGVQRRRLRFCRQLHDDFGPGPRIQPDAARAPRALPRGDRASHGAIRPAAPAPSPRANSGAINLLGTTRQLLISLQLRMICICIPARVTSRLRLTRSPACSQIARRTDTPPSSSANWERPSSSSVRWRRRWHAEPAR